MLIKNLFERDIFRPINGVVKADQLDDSSVWQELDEFVVTRELDQHFRKFFSAYSDAIKTPNEPRSRRQDRRLDLGVLRVRQVALPQGSVLPAAEWHVHSYNGESKQAVEFFESKIKDAMLFGDIKRAVASHTDVILFNIDSKADHRAGRDAILASSSKSSTKCRATAATTRTSPTWNATSKARESSQAVPRCLPQGHRERVDQGA